MPTIPEAPLDIDLKARVDAQIESEDKKESVPHANILDDVKWRSRQLDFSNGKTYTVGDFGTTNKANYLMDQASGKNAKIFALGDSPYKNFGNTARGQVPFSAYSYGPASESLMSVAKSLTSELSAGAMEAILGDLVPMESKSSLKLFDEDEEQKPIIELEKAINAYKTETSLFGSAYAPFGPVDLVGGNKVMASPAYNEGTPYEEQWRPENCGDNQRPVNELGQELPVGAIMWDSNNKAYYGDNWNGLAKKFISEFKTAKQYDWGGKTDSGSVPAQLFNSWYGKTYGKYSALRTTIRAFGGALLDIWNSAPEWTERFGGTVSLAMEQEVQAAGYKTYEELGGIQGDHQGEQREISISSPGTPGGMAVSPQQTPIAGMTQYPQYMPGTPMVIHPDSEKSGAVLAIERMNPIRNAYNALQMWRVIISGKRTMKDYVNSMALNWETSRMAYSIGANDNATKNEFYQRVYIDGERAEMVARDMENPGAEMIGQIIGDPLNLLDLITPATLGKLHMVTDLKAMGASDNIVKAIGEVADLAGQSKALKAATEVVESGGEYNAITKAVAETVLDANKGMVDEAFSFGPFKRYGSSRQSKAMTRVETLSKLLLASADNADEAAEVTRLMAYIGSGDEAMIAQALPRLAELIDLNPALSPTGLEFGRYMYRMMDNGKGAINTQAFTNQVTSFINKGDMDGLIEHVLDRTARAIQDEYPTVKQIVEAQAAIIEGNVTGVNPGALRFLEGGGELSKMDKVIGVAVNNAWTRLTGGLAGRAFIGSTPGPAMRGITFDTFWSTVNMGPGVNYHTPTVWADITTGWYGVEHAGLAKGFGKQAIPGMNQWSKAHSSYEDIGTLIDAVLNRGMKAEDVGMTIADYGELITNYGGRMMGYFEKLSSMRVVGKATQDAMTHYIKTGFKNVDDLVAMGIPVDSARAVRQRLINSLGDTDKVLADILTEINGIGGVDAFKSGAWISDETYDVLTDINIQREVSKLLDKGQTRTGIVESLERLRKNVLDNIGDIENLHVTSDQMYEAFPAMHQAVANKLFGGTDALEINNLVTANGLVGTSLQDAMNYVNKVVLDEITKLRKAGDLGSVKVADELDGVLKSIPSGIQQNWTNITVENQVKNNYLFSKVKESLKDAETVQEIEAVVADAWKALGIKADLPKPPYSKDNLFDLIFRMYKSDSKAEFKHGRNAMLGIWDEFLANITRADSGGGIVESILKSKQVAAVDIAATRANSLDNMVIVNGKMKPIGPVIRSLTASGNEEQAVRLIASHLNPFSDYTMKGSVIADTELLRIFTHYDSSVDNLADVTADMAVTLMNKYRKEQGFEVFANTIEDLVGRNIYTDIPEFAQAPAAYLYQFRTDGPDTLNSLRRRDLFTFLEEQGQSEEILNTIMTKKQVGDSSYVDDLVTESQRVVDEILDGVGDSEVIAGTVDDIPSVIPPFDDSNGIEYGRHIYERVGHVEQAFDDLIRGVGDNWGKIDYTNVTEDQVRGITTWFDDAKIKMDVYRQGAAKYSQGMRDLLLHDYEGDKLGVDAMISSMFQFHFWPSRTAITFAKRIPYNMGKIAAFNKFQDYLGKIHAGMPEWYRYTVNTNEILGTNHDNPIFINLVNFMNPFANMMGGFDNPEARVNWYSALYDGMSKVPFGYPNIGIGLLVTAGLVGAGEQEWLRGGGDEDADYKQAAALLSGRGLPITGFIKGASALLGVKDGKGVELDPLIRFTSEQGFFGDNVMGPFEIKRVNNALAMLQQKNPEHAEEIMESARTHEGVWWETAMRISRKKDAVGNILSMFTGVNSRLRSKEDLTIEQFWQDYTFLWSTSENMSPDEVRENLNALHKKYPFAETMLLGRRGGEERDEAYTYAIFSRIMPGKTDDTWKAMGLPYDMISDFYENKGFPESWEQSDKEDFMNGVLALGAALAIPADATRNEWDEASKRYREMMEAGEEIFGKGIWELADGAYQYKEAGTSAQNSWYDYMDMFPNVEQAMDWKSHYVLDDQILSAYYGGLNAYRSYYTGVMYNELEKKYGVEIFDKNTIYSGMLRSGLDKEAREYRKANSDLDNYLSERSKYYDEIENVVVEFADRLPEGIPTERREDFVPSTYKEEAVDQYLSNPTVPSFTKNEWIKMLDSYTVNVIQNIYDGVDVNDQAIRNYLEGVAEAYGMDYYTFIESVGGAD